MRFFLIFLVAAALASCTKSKGPLQTYFVGATRFTSGNRTGVGPADTLATRFYVDSLSNSIGLKNVRITVDYSPRRLPFVYPTPITAVLPSWVATSEQLVYMDSTLIRSPKELLLTIVYGVRTSAGSERWTYTATDNAGNTSARSFVITQRRADSTAVYNDYTLKLPVPATSKVARRFIDLKSGLALPASSVVGTPNNPELQRLTDVIVMPDGLTLSSPDALDPVVYFKSGKWLKSDLSTTRFYLTALTPTDFTGVTDAVGLLQRFVEPGVPQISGLLVGQVYAFYVTNGTAGRLYGLLRVVALPAGTTAGLQLEIRIAKPLS